LAQPWPDWLLLEENLKIRAISLRGWSVVEIAGEFLTNNSELTATAAQVKIGRVRYSATVGWGKRA
jgi:hypothetical protein